LLFTVAELAWCSPESSPWFCGEDGMTS
jgi:hypothetical protein